jgi:hypothetical protein
MLMIAYTAWDSLQALAQQYDADLVIAPGERLGLTRRRNRYIPRATVRRLGERLRAGLSVLQVQAPAGGHISEEPIARNNRDGLGRALRARLGDE